MSVPPFGLPPTTVEKIREVLARHPQVTKAVLYGSRAKGNYKNGSDIDLTLEGQNLTHDILLQIIGQLDDLLLPYTMDLSLFTTLSHPELINHIHRIGLVLYEQKS